MLKFLKEYIKNPRYIGAVAPSSSFLASEMISNIDFNSAKCIVEYGAGDGVFTGAVINCLADTTVFLVFETNENFYKKLIYRYSKLKNVHIINDSAENVKYYLNKFGISCVDYVISGLPFASLPSDVSENIIRATYDILGDTGEFVTFQYTKFKKKFFQNNFSSIETKRILRNLPPAYVFRCANVSVNSSKEKLTM